MTTTQRSYWSGKIIVITGATAGAGRATAVAFAKQGARVALLAREPEGLEETKAEVEAAGGTALGIPTDMADADAVFKAADEIKRLFGPADIWINNAMVTVFSPVERLNPDEARRVTEVTYLGTVYGTMAALQTMKEHGRGTIIQVSSGLAYRAIPLQSAYCAAKHAGRAFTESLRCELLSEDSPIQLCSVLLPGLNTPQFDWSLTHEPDKPRPVAPVYQPEVAARAILNAARYPKREYFVGYQTPLLTMGTFLMPGTMDQYLARTAIKGQRTGVPLPPDRANNLYTPVPGKHTTRGRFGHESDSRAVTMSGGMARGLGVAVLLAMGAVIGRFLTKRH